MHLAYVVGKFPERSETFLRREIAALASRGFRVTVCAARAGDGTSSAEDVSARGLRVIYRPPVVSAAGFGALAWLCFCHPLRLVLLLAYACVLATRGWRWSWRLLCRLPAVAFYAGRLERDGVDLVHGYYLNLPAVLAMGVAVAAGVPFTLAGHARDVFVERGPAALLARHARCVVLCSRSAAAEVALCLADGVRSKLHVVYHGIDLTRWRWHGGSVNRPRPGPPTLLAVGRFVEKKGFDVLIRSCAVLRQRCVPFRLRMVGDGPQAPAIRELAERLGLGDRVAFDGWQRGDARRSAFRSATVLVVPSVVAADGDRDGIPNVVLEAAACGVPVIASRLPGLAEVIDDGVTGVLTEPGDRDDLARAIERLLGDEALRDRLAVEARGRVETEFAGGCNAAVLQRLLERAGEVRPCA